MKPFALPLLIYYAAAVAIFCVYGLHRYWLLWLFWRTGGLRGGDAPPCSPLPPGPDGPEDLPRVTVQLPMFNEPRVVERIIRAACALDYPRDRLQIQVLDDSTDETAAIARRCCARLAEAGHDIVHRHRTNRAGFKAGALAEGLETATGEFVAIFDADFVPPAGILRELLPTFADPEVGLVQARWTHLNREESILTRIQAMCLDGHFVIEQTARARTGRWFNFNGTAGIWRRRCIDDAGGWEHDTLTEDTDLSYRAQLRGWRFAFRPEVTCPAELPPTVNALMTQQHRWSKGLVQNAIKLLPTILRSRTPLRARIEAFLHLTSPLPYAAILLLTLLVPPAFLIGQPVSGVSPLVAVGLGLVCLLLGTMAAASFYVASQTAQGRSPFTAALLVPVLMAVGVGVSIMNTRAIAAALLGRDSPFVRTPKFAGNDRSELDPLVRRRRLPPGTLELAMGLVMVACIAHTFHAPFTLVGLPFLLLFAAGYLTVGLPPLRSLLERSREAGRRSAVLAIAQE